MVRFLSVSEGCTWLGALACLLRVGTLAPVSLGFFCKPPAKLLQRVRNSCCSKPESSWMHSGKALRIPPAFSFISVSAASESDALSGSFPMVNTTGVSIERWPFRRRKRLRSDSCCRNRSMQSSIRVEGTFL